MRIRLTLLAATVAAAGFAAAALVTEQASAWDWQSLPSGYSVRVETSVPGCSGSDVTVNGSHIGCTADSGFQSALDAYINSTICTVSPSAGGSACTTSTTTTPPTTSTATSSDATTPATTTAAAAGTTTSADTSTSSGSSAPATTTTSGSSLAAPPAAAFTSTIVGLNVRFADVSSATAPATVKTISWQFGDGGTAVGASPTHVYTLPGTFTVVEIVTDTNGLADQATTKLTLSAFAGPRRFAEHVSPRLSSAASRIGPQPVRVFCVSAWGPAKPEAGGGLAILGSRQANISQPLCRALVRKRGPVARALLTLGHETAHALGIRQERTADCYSLKRLPRLERTLGIRVRGVRAQAAAIVKTRWRRGCWG